MLMTDAWPRSTEVSLPSGSKYTLCTCKSRLIKTAVPRFLGPMFTIKLKSFSSKEQVLKLTSCKHATSIPAPVKKFLRATRLVGSLNPAIFNVAIVKELISAYYERQI